MKYETKDANSKMICETQSVFDRLPSALKATYHAKRHVYRLL